MPSAFPHAHLHPWALEGVVVSFKTPWVSLVMSLCYNTMCSFCSQCFLFFPTGKLVCVTIDIMTFLAKPVGGYVLALFVLLL